MSGGKGGKGQDTQVQQQTTEPPAYVLPHLQAGAGAAYDLFRQGPRYVPFSQQTNQAMNMQQNRALSGSPVVDSAQNLASDTLNGNYLNSNPYLDSTFDRAAGAVNRSLDETYARSGRDLDSNMGVRSDQLNNLATSIYGGNYQAERDRQMGAMSSAIPLGREDYYDISQLGDVGAAVEGQAGNIIDAPYSAVNRYISQAQGMPGQTTSTPMTRNRLGGALGGAATGAAVGTQIMPGWGTAIGAVGGGLMGYMQ